MKKVKSGKQLAEATRKVPVAVEPAPPAKARGAKISAASEAKSGRRATSTAKGRPSSKVAKRAASAVGGRKARGSKRTAKSGTRQKAAMPKAAAPSFQIRQLDPLRVCGDRTSVVQLYRVDEELVPVGKAAGARQVHLVFNDRHGWYCEHGRSCHAVSAVMRHAGIR